MSLLHIEPTTKKARQNTRVLPSFFIVSELSAAAASASREEQDDEREDDEPCAAIGAVKKITKAVVVRA